MKKCVCILFILAILCQPISLIAEDIFPCNTYNPFQNLRKMTILIKVDGLGDRSQVQKISEFLKIKTNARLYKERIKRIPFKELFLDGRMYIGHFEDTEGKMEIKATFLPEKNGKTSDVVFELNVAKFYLIEPGCFGSFPCFSSTAILEEQDFEFPFRNSMDYLGPVLEKTLDDFFGHIHRVADSKSFLQNHL